MSFFRFRKQENKDPREYFLAALRLVEWGDFATAETLFEKCIACDANQPHFHFHLGDVRQRTDKRDEAIASYRDYLRLDPADTLGAGIRLSILGATSMPDILPRRYVEYLFDQYAPSFEKCLVENLEYDVPNIMSSTIFDCRCGPYGRVLDLGCGTGLSGEPFQEHSDRIDGVDISQGMLDIARDKGIYDALHIADVAEFIKADTSSYDLILCAEVLIYIGRCEALFMDVVNRLTDNGLFSFSIQEADGDVVLGPDHRYSHGGQYVEGCLEAAGMSIVSSQQAILRKEDGVSVQGIIFVCEKKKRPV